MAMEMNLGPESIREIVADRPPGKESRSADRKPRQPRPPFLVCAIRSLTSLSVLYPRARGDCDVERSEVVRAKCPTMDRNDEREHFYQVRFVHPYIYRIRVSGGFVYALGQFVNLSAE